MALNSSPWGVPSGAADDQANEAAVFALNANCVATASYRRAFSIVVVELAEKAVPKTVQYTMIASELLFDTSAAQGISGARLDRLKARGYLLRVSPYSAWEMMCHLDAALEEFELRRANMLKLRKFEVLDDPRACLEMALGISQHRRQTGDSTVICAFLERLARVRSLDELRSEPLVLPNGSLRSVKSCPTEARRALDGAAAEFRQLLESAGRRILETHGGNPSDEARLSHAVSLARGDFERARRAGSVTATLPRTVDLNFHVLGVCCRTSLTLSRSKRANGAK